MKKITIGVVSYNSIPPYKDGCEEISINRKDVLILSKTFNPKSPGSVLPTDLNWVELMSHREELQKVIIFAGKKESGALEIIDLAVESFSNKKEILFFVLCDHEQKEKVERLKHFGISEKQYICFSDGHERCYETPFLLGFMHDYIDKEKYPP